MKKLLFLLLFIPLVSLSQEWTPEIKVNFMRSCIVSYLDASEKTGGRQKGTPNKLTSRIKRRRYAYDLDEILYLNIKVKNIVNAKDIKKSHSLDLNIKLK